MNKQFLTLVALIAFLSVGFAAVVWKKSREQSEMEKTVATLRLSLAERDAQAEKDRAELAALRSRADAFKSESTELRKKLTAGGGAASETTTEKGGVSAATGAGTGQEKGGFMKGLAKMFTDPEMKKAMRSQQGMMIRMMYGDLAKELGLSPDEAGPILEILTERQMTMAAKGMEMMGGDTSDEARLEESSKGVAALKEEHDAQLKGLLGEERMKKLNDYERTLGDRMQMQQIQQSFAATGSPLPEAQRDGLMNIMKEERLKTPPSPFDPGSTNVKGQIKAMRGGEGLGRVAQQAKEFNERVLERARALLSPEQVNALEASQKQQLEMMEMGLKMSQQMMKGDGAAPADAAPSGTP